MAAPSNIIIQTLSDGVDRRFVFYEYAASGVSLIGHIDSSAGDWYGSGAVPVSVGGVCYVYGLGSIAAKIEDGSVSVVADPMPAVESGATGASSFQYFVTSDSTYLVRGWYHAGRDESYKVIYLVGPDGAEFAYQTSDSFSVPSTWTNAGSSGTYLPQVGAIDGTTLWLRGQAAWGTSSPAYEYQSLDLVSGAIATTPPSGVTFPNPYDGLQHVWVFDYHYAWDSGASSIDTSSEFTQHTMLLIGDAEFESGGNNEGSTFFAYPAADAWATSSAGHGSPSVSYTNLTYTASGFTKLNENYIYSVFGSMFAPPPDSWWKNKTGVIEVAT